MKKNQGVILVPVTSNRAKQQQPKQQVMLQTTTMPSQAKSKRTRRNASSTFRSAPIAVGSTGRANSESVLYRRREYVGEVNASDPFTATSYPINPGLNELFPWLSGIASSFEEYVIQSMKFEFVAKSATTTAGSVMMAVDYDAADSAPTSKATMLSNAGAVSSNAWKSVNMQLQDKSSAYAKHYVRTGKLSPNLDIKTYDVGNLIVAVQGTGSSVGNLGELWVEYRLQLCTPQSSGDAPVVGRSSKITINSTTVATPFLSAVVAGGLNITVSGQTITFNDIGEFLISAFVTGTTVSGPSWSGSGGASVLQLAATAAPTANFTATASVIVTAVGAKVNMILTQGTLTGGTLRINPYPVTALG